MKQKYEKHHIWPKSRLSNPLPNNTAMVEGIKHRQFHTLFNENGKEMTPHEIIEVLVYYYWEGQWKHFSEFKHLIP